MLSRLRSPWSGFLITKALEILVSVAVLIVVTFVIVLLVPGDPARSAAGVDATLEQVEMARERMGLDKPVLEQFWAYLTGLFQGDLGQSYRTANTVVEVIGVRLPYTVSLTVVSIILTVIVAVSAGMIVAGLTRGGRNRWLDIGFSWATALFQSAPTYVIGSILVAVFAVSLGILPAAGANTPVSYVLPVIAMSIGPICAVARVVRREAATALEQDYMRTARGRRISAAKQYVVYALPNLLASTLTLSGLILASMLGGAIIIESVFAWPGLGSAIVTAIIDRDYPVIRGIILTVGTLAVLIHVAIDIVLASVDPRTLSTRKTLV